MGKAIPYKGGQTVIPGEVATLLGKSYDWFHDNLQYSKKYMKEVPNKTPGSRATYAYHDVIRFRDLSNWGI
ncbi:hypothetical protein [Periweissella ghanensis]|uniref:hypothetical protein n=1 Tax=Periweissella ghanensis TaxID=467997 RepID=UPI002030FD23|nr:hypothetical protein [Periweissella ghanensis]MCM0601472.1 hypothetical protein [Periweissella ghanensis]